MIDKAVRMTAIAVAIISVGVLIWLIMLLT
jgi:hypothetical protein